MPLPTAKVVHRDSEVIYLPHWKDYNGTPLLTTAGGLYPKPIVKPVAVGIIHVEFWQPSYTDAQYVSQLNATNSGAWKGWPAGQAWISRILTHDEKIEDTDGVWMHYIVRCCELGWDQDFPSMGYYYVTGGDKTAFTTIDGFAYIGQHDAAGDNGEPTAYFQEEQLKRRISFSFLD